ncbi:MAG: hydrogenase [Spirochaetes bacterium]|nr:MAG: hydrogenase [Spirochaetota bacterium]
MFRLIDKTVKYAQRKSPWILHLDTGGCNGCSIEVFAVLSPRYDIERFGGLSKANPRHTDILMIDGAITKKIRPRLERIYRQIPEPKIVMAIGSCAISKGIFYDAYNIDGPLDRIIPVDVYVPGCPPKPEAILHGVVKALKLWEEKYSV